jgi:hypothetical protein
MRPAVGLLLILLGISLAGPGCKRGGASFLRTAARVAVTAVAAVAAAAATRRTIPQDRVPVVLPQAQATPGPDGTTLLPALGSVSECEGAPPVEVRGCLQPGLFRPHDDWSACAYYCLDHCEYHGASAATVRPLRPEEAAALLLQRRTAPAVPPAPPPVEPPPR